MSVCVCVCLKDWFTVLEHYNRLNATISDLIMGNTYKFRVFGENKCGMSESAAVTKEEAKILKTGTFLKKSYKALEGRYQKCFNLFIHSAVDPALNLKLLASAISKSFLNLN